MRLLLLAVLLTSAPPVKAQPAGTREFGIQMAREADNGFQLQEKVYMTAVDPGVRAEALRQMRGFATAINTFSVMAGMSPTPLYDVLISQAVNEVEQRGSKPGSPTTDEQGATNTTDGSKKPLKVDFLGGVAAGVVSQGLTGASAANSTVPANDPSNAAPALRIVNEYVARNPKDPDALAARSLFRRASGDREGAQADAKAALALDPHNKLALSTYEFHDEQGQAAARAGGVMTGGFDPAKAAQPSGGAAESGVTGVSFKPRTPAEKKAALDALAVSAAGIRPGVTPSGQAQALIQSAVGKLALGDSNGALLDLSRALMFDKDNVRAHVLRSHISNLWRNKNWKAAILEADAALKLDPRSAAAMFEKGYALLQQGDTAGALRVIEEGLSIEPDNAMGRYYHAMVLEKVGLVARAVAEYKEAMRLDPALAPLVEEALSKISGYAQGGAAAETKSRRSLRLHPAALGLFGLGALAMLVWLARRAFFKDHEAAALALAARGDAQAIPAASGQTPTLTPGSVLDGSFRIDKELARGGLGIVYQATDVRLKRAVAIKRLNREAYASPELRERFMKEAQLAARLRHPNLAQIFSVVGDEDLHLVFELVEGETVHDRLVRDGKLPVKLAAAILAGAGAAVDYAHGQNVIHRDLKPANMMIDASGTVKILDFGIAHETRRAEGATQTQAWGTPPYMAPEQEMGSVCRESDLYALGVVAYELVTGRRPFVGSYLLAMKQQKQFPPVPGELKAFFERALDPDPSKRFRTATELARALAAIESTPLHA